MAEELDLKGTVTRDYQDGDYPKTHQRQPKESNLDPDAFDQDRRVGGQTNYDPSQLEPHLFEAIKGGKPQYQNKLVDAVIVPVPIFIREDTALVVYDAGQQLYNATLDGGGNLTDNEIFRVESGWEWLIDRVAIFGSGFIAGGAKLYDGSTADDSSCFCVQPGVAAPINGGVQSLDPAPLLTRRSPIGLKVSGGGAAGSISVGIWYRKCKWVWTPERYFQEDRISQ